MSARVYLAGPDVFFPDAKKLAVTYKAILAEYGLDGQFPLDNQIQAATLQETALAIFEANYRLIDSCDAVLANMVPFRGPSMDVGTAWEVGYAYAQGKPIVGYTDILTPYRTKVHHSGFSQAETDPVDHLGHEIEHFEGIDNLMLTQSVRAIKPTLREAAEYLATIV